MKQFSQRLDCEVIILFFAYQREVVAPGTWKQDVEVTRYWWQWWTISSSTEHAWWCQLEEKRTGDWSQVSEYCGVRREHSNKIENKLIFGSIIAFGTSKIIGSSEFGKQISADNWVMSDNLFVHVCLSMSLSCWTFKYHITDYFSKYPWLWLRCIFNNFDF